jgi:3D (Asp-Asp-Asp) domain-containing protein
MDNVKTYCKRVGLLLVSAAFACSALITVNGEAAKEILAFKPVHVGEDTKDSAEYAFGDVAVVDYGTIQNNCMVAQALGLAGEVEPAIADVEEKDTEVVASASVYIGASAAPVYADPSANGYEYIGTYLTTGYCPCAQCCGKSTGITASGTVAAANHTIAADTSILPFGTQVVINGQVYTVEDRGSAIRGGRIDIFFSTHQEALNYGKRYVNVYRYVGVSENSSPIAEETSTDVTEDVSTDTEAVEATEATEATTEAVEATEEGTRF